MRRAFGSVLLVLVVLGVFSFICKPVLLVWLASAAPAAGSAFEIFFMVTSCSFAIFEVWIGVETWEVVASVRLATRSATSLAHGPKYYLLRLFFLHKPKNYAFWGVQGILEGTFGYRAWNRLLGWPTTCFEHIVDALTCCPPEGSCHSHYVMRFNVLWKRGCYLSGMLIW